MDKKLPVLKSTGQKWCKHRTAFWPKDEFPVCKVGIDFHKFDGRLNSMPCLGETVEAIARCPEYEAHTYEELAAVEAERDKRFGRMGIIRKAIIETVQKTGQRSGQMSCPACSAGTVSYSQASCNGHVHASCSTDGCASWME